MNSNKKTEFEKWCIKETIAKIMFITFLPLSLFFTYLYKIFEINLFGILLIISVILGCLGGFWLAVLYNED